MDYKSIFCILIAFYGIGLSVSSGKLLCISFYYYFIMFLNFRTLVACQKGNDKTVQTQISLLLKKQSDQVFHVCDSDQHFVNSSPVITNILVENRFDILEQLIYYLLV